MNILHLFLVVWATHSIAHTVTTQVIFKPLREWLAPKLGEAYWGNLIRCPYCFAHWVALGLTLVTGLTFTITSNWFINTFVTWMAITGMANIISWVLCEKIKKPKETVAHAEPHLINFPNQITVH
jgi:hypothetical protein